ncbi:MAG: sigma-70 family RNA polymerase sigma factor [Gemmataceae bacterium]|nr:sigma-70 family RNA polymerase sigma factor [Gemmataceae bacterium]
MSEVTRILSAVESGDTQAAAQLLPLVYEELRHIAAQKMAHELPGQTLQATALVHEAFVRLVDTERIQQWNSRGHFFAAAAEAMRRILVERARHKDRVKTGGEFRRHDIADVDPASAEPDVDLLALNEALDQLEKRNPRQAGLVKLRFFGGLTMQEASEAMGISLSTAEKDWAYARCWLRLAMEGDEFTGLEEKSRIK